MQLNANRLVLFRGWCSLFLTSGEPSVNRRDLRVLTFAGPTRDNPVPDPLAVLHLDNQQFMYTFVYIQNKFFESSLLQKNYIT